MQRLLPLLLLSLPAAGFGAGVLVSAPQEPALPKPGKQHEWLRKGEGLWDAKMIFQGQESPGTEKNTLVCNGLWGITEFQGTFGGMPFEGHGITGWDARKKKYVFSWVDNFDGSMSVAYGDLVDGKLVFDTESVDPFSGETVPVQHVTEFVDDDHRIMRFMLVTPEGPVEQMRIEYTRRK